VRRIEQGDFSARARTGARGIMQVLEDGINRMAVTLSGARADLEQRVLDATAQLQQQKERAEQASRAKTQFVDALLHDLSQPLMAMGLDIRTLKLRLRDDESSGLLTRLERSSMKLENMRDVLLDVARLESGATQPRITDFPLWRVFESLRLTFEAQAAEKGLRFELYPTRAWCRSDPLLLERVLANLVSNALRYTRSGGVVVGARRRGADVAIEVIDSGIGIASEHRDRIFDEFFQVPGRADRPHPGGMGLGLAIVRRFAALLGHNLGLVSRPGHGSRFSIVALRAADAPPMRSRAGHRCESLAGACIAVIDDDPAAVEGLRALFSSWGADVAGGAHADDVLAALGEVERYPDLIIADLRLAGEASGLAAIERLRREFGEPVPALVVSGDLREVAAREVREAGHLLLSKPVVPASLEAAASNLVAGLAAR